MKNLVIVIGTIILGSMIFQMMVGDGENSLKHTVSTVMRYHIGQYAQQEEP